MNTIKNKTPVVVNISLTQARLERYAFYTPAFISEHVDFTDRSVEVFQLSDVIKAGYSQDSSAYIYCALAFAQTERVDSVILVAKKSNETYLEAYKESPINKYYFLSLESQNEDDVLETFFLNLLYGGNISTFAPTAYMDRSKITLIRPLIYAPERCIKTFVKKNGIEVMPKCCPMDGVSKREDMKNLIWEFQKKIPNVKANIYGAIKRSNIKGWNK